MGLACSLDIYQEKMSELFIDMTFIIVYQDDILVLTSGSFDDHLRQQLSNVFKQLQHNNLQVNAKKSSFCALETEYLGFILTREGIKPQQQNVNAILQVAPPRNVKQVRSFVGMLNHYKAMIPHRSHPLALLTALTKKNIKFEWTKEHQQAFDSLKNSLAREVVLAYPDFSVPFEIYTDALKYQIGSVITQKDKPLAFYSRKLTDTQTRYTVTELELLAIVEMLREYKCILLGHLITIYMDHKNLTFSNFTTDHVTHWRLIVEEYGPKIVYLPDKRNIIADALSRLTKLEDPHDESTFLEEIFALDEQTNVFPIAFKIISKAQLTNKKFQQCITNNDPDFKTRIIQ
jgi:hypothetical protein